MSMSGDRLGAESASPCKPTPQTTLVPEEGTAMLTTDLVVGEEAPEWALRDSSRLGVMVLP